MNLQEESVTKVPESQADMALRNIALKVDTERMKKRYEMQPG